MVLRYRGHKLIVSIPEALSPQTTQVSILRLVGEEGVEDTSWLEQTSPQSPSLSLQIIIFQGTVALEWTGLKVDTT
jgi:hypothetical protein